MLRTDESDYQEDVFVDLSETPKTDREVLDAILASQLRVEAAVTDALSGMVPMLEAVKTKGIMGLMTMGK